MNKCPITYQECEKRFSQSGLNLLSKKLDHLKDIPFTAEALRREAITRSSKMSVQGVQSKLSAVLNIKKSVFEIVDTAGRYILKPQSHLHRELPENEDLSMHLAKEIGIEVPVHGLVYASDGSPIYFIKRFDRKANNTKYHVEDFAQLAGETRDTKYNYSMEKLVPIIENHCTVPVIEKAELFKRTIFNFLIGNEDMHLKNFSLIIRGELIKLAPAYDFLNTTIALENPKEELALPLKGKKSGITKNILLEYWAKDRLRLEQKAITSIMDSIEKKLVNWNRWISSSFLSNEMKKSYTTIIIDRAERLNIDTSAFKNT